MNSHERAQELISARMDAPLSPAEHRELQAHLATCTSCRLFVTQVDELSRGMQIMPRLGPSPDVSRAVLATVYGEDAGWLWLRRGLQLLSSPGLAVASAVALVVALSGALILAMNGPGGVANEPESTVVGMTDIVIPTEAPTETPVPEPTATVAPARTVTEPEPEPTAPPARTPTPRPTETPRIVLADNPESGAGAEQPVVAEPPIEPVSEEPVLAMAPEDTGEAAPAEMAQTVADPAVDAGPVDAAAAEAPVEEVVETEAAANDGGDRKGGRKDDGGKVKDDVAAAAEPVESTEPAPTHEIAPLQLPREAIDAMEAAGTAPDVMLPPAPLDPMMPSQDFLPVTPTPVSDGSPTPEPPTESNAPQLAEDWSNELGVAALAPEPTPDVTVIEAPDESTVVEGEKDKSRDKRDKSNKEGKSHEEQQVAYVVEPMSWQSAEGMLAPSPSGPTLLAQVADETTTAETSEGTTTTETGAVEDAPLIDPATGLEIDPASGLLIDPATGYLIDVANGRVVDPRTGYVVDPMTGLLIDPATGARLDPNTLAIVIPAGFGSDQPAYVPGSPDMRGQIETVVDATYDDATYKVIPGTDGPVQPVGEIIVPTESGDALEIQ
jgi:hypothetical protein